MSYEYRLVKENLYHEDIGSYETAGIELLQNVGMTLQRIDFQSDISSNFSDVQLLVDLMNRIHVSPTMFHKVVEDVFFS